jgi:hypothetical protein
MRYLPESTGPYALPEDRDAGGRLAEGSVPKDHTQGS